MSDQTRRTNDGFEITLGPRTSRYRCTKKYVGTGDDGMEYPTVYVEQIDDPREYWTLSVERCEALGFTPDVGCEFDMTWQPLYSVEGILGVENVVCP